MSGGIDGFNVAGKPIARKASAVAHSGDRGVVRDGMGD
jgi:hypothetical protein